MSGDRFSNKDRMAALDKWNADFEQVRTERDSLRAKLAEVERERAAWVNAAIGGFGEGTTPANLLEGAQSMEQALHDSERELELARKVGADYKHERDAAQESAARFIDKRNALQAKLAAAEQEASRLREALGFDQPWPAADVLEKVGEVIVHLLADHDCDRHGWEALRECRIRAFEYAARIRAALSPSAAQPAQEQLSKKEK